MSYVETSCREVLRIDAGPSYVCARGFGHAGTLHVYTGHLNGRKVTVSWRDGGTGVEIHPRMG